MLMEASLASVLQDSYVRTESLTQQTLSTLVPLAIIVSMGFIKRKSALLVFTEERQEVHKRLIVIDVYLGIFATFCLTKLQ